MLELTSVQVATEHCQYSELVGEPLKLELYINFPLEHVTDFIVLGEQLSLVSVEVFGFVEQNIQNGCFS